MRQGVDVVFATCATLTQSLNAARASGSYERKLASLAKVPLLIIDDFGLKALSAPFDEDLLDLISERYERTTTGVTSNLDYEEWDMALAVNRLLGSTTLDRLRHNANCLDLDGESYRAPQLLPKAGKTVTQKEAKFTIFNPPRMSFLLLFVALLRRPLTTHSLDLLCLPLLSARFAVLVVESLGLRFSSVFFVLHTRVPRI